MNVNECREEIKRFTQYVYDNLSNDMDGALHACTLNQTKALWEIAAQLAELNEHLKPRLPILYAQANVPEGMALCMRIDHKHKPELGCWTPRDKSEREKEMHDHWPGSQGG